MFLASFLCRRPANGPGGERTASGWEERAHQHQQARTDLLERAYDRASGTAVLFGTPVTVEPAPPVEAA